MYRWLVAAAFCTALSFISPQTVHAGTVGAALVFPYYQASSGATTYFDLYNRSDQVTCQPVMVEIHSQDDGSILNRFCMAMAPDDLATFQLSRDSKGWVVWRRVLARPHGCSLSDCNCSALGVSPLDDEAITTSGGSSCHLSPEAGYAVAYGVTDCKSGMPDANATLGGMEIVKETGRDKLYGMTAKAAEVNASSPQWKACDSNATDPRGCKLRLLSDAFRARSLRIPYNWNHSLLILTVPYFGDPTLPQEWRMSGAVGENQVTDDLIGCGFVRINRAFSTFVNSDGTVLKDTAPFYYPANAVSVIIMAGAPGSAGLTDASYFYALGDMSGWGLGLVLGNLDGKRGVVQWDVPQWVDGYSGVLSADFSDERPKNYMAFPFRNVVATTVYGLESDLVWSMVPSR